VIFDVGISEMLLNFYVDGVFTEDELATICEYSLTGGK